MNRQGQIDCLVELMIHNFEKALAGAAEEYGLWCLDARTIKPISKVAWNLFRSKEAILNLLVGLIQDPMTVFTDKTIVHEVYETLQKIDTPKISG